MWVISLVMAYLTRLIAFYVAFKQSGWLSVDKEGIAIISLFSLIMGVVIPAPPFDFVGILIRMVALGVIIMAIADVSIDEGISIAIMGAIFSAIITLVLSIFMPSLVVGINPFSIP